MASASEPEAVRKTFTPLVPLSLAKGEGEGEGKESGGHPQTPGRGGTTPSALPQESISGQALGTFNEYAGRYDAWYDNPMGRTLLDSEVACLRPLLERSPRPYLETGVGTGRFAEALGIEYSLDPSPKALEMARRRDVNGVLGLGEQLPFKGACFGGVLMAFSLCFVQAPYNVLSEARRVLVGGGGLVLGLLLKGTPWADYYAQRGAEGHPIYRAARFYSREEVVNLLHQTGFQVARYRSTLFQELGLEVYQKEQPIEGYVAGVGFVGIAASRAN